ncbi:MAG TPA: M24 family metallopeptidase [Acidimicrobiia bacterium]|nr:M24 family metallopeptidase [Acidimicrobiia bacterium]
MSSGRFGQHLVSHHEGFPRYSPEEMKRRHEWLGGIMVERELDAVLVGGATGPLETSVQYFCNWPPQVMSYLLFRSGEAPILSVRLWNHLPDAQRISVVSEVIYGGDTPTDQAEAVAGRLAGSQRVGLIGSVPHDDVEILRTVLPDARFISLNPAYQEFRLVKSKEEMMFTRIASRMNDAAVEALAAELGPGMSERQVARIVEETYLGEGGVNLIHFSLTTPMEDPRVQVPHQYHPDRTLEAGDVFVTEISTTFWGYAGQILRTFTIGTDPTSAYQRLHEVATEVYQSILSVLKPGVSVGELLDEADGVTQAGFDIWDDLVHGFGGAYLPPILRTRASRGATHPDDWTYPEGALVVVQPNVVDGLAGVQVGNSIWIAGDGPEVTQAFPMEIRRCG